jgi:hypothetical protein
MDEETPPPLQRKPPIPLIGAGILALLLAIGIYITLDQASPQGDLIRFVPSGCDAFIHAHQFEQEIQTFLDSEEWNALAQSERLERFKKSRLFQNIQTRWQHLNSLTPFKLSLQNLMLVAGTDAGLAVRIDAASSKPSLLGLTRTNLALANSSWAGAFINAEKKKYSGCTVLHAKAEDTHIYGTSLGNLVLVSTDYQMLRDSIDLCQRKTKSNFADAASSLPSPSVEAGPSIDLLLNLGDSLRKGMPKKRAEDSSVILSALHSRLSALSVPPEALALGTVFFSNKVEALEDTGFVKASITYNKGMHLRLNAAVNDSGTPLAAPTFSIHNNLPKNVGYTSVELIEFRGWFKDLVKDEIDDPAEVESELATFTTFLGIKNFESEFLDLFGPQVSIIFAPQLPEGGAYKFHLPAAATAIELRDPAKVSKFLAKSFDQVMGDMHADHAALQKQIPPDQGKEFPFESEEIQRGDYKYTRIRMRENFLGRALSPAFGVIDSFLYIATSHRLLDAIIDTRRSEQIPLSKQPGFARLFEKLDAPQSGFWYLSPPNLAEAIMPIAISYIETHQVWPQPLKNEYSQRLRELADFIALFKSIAFATRQQGDIRTVHLVSQLSSE